MRRAAEGHITTEALMWNQNQEPTISGMSADEFRDRLNQVLKEEGYDIDNKRYPEGYQEAPLAYDAVWSVALGKTPFFPISCLDPFSALRSKRPLCPSRIGLGSD